MPLKFAVGSAPLLNWSKSQASKVARKACPSAGHSRRACVQNLRRISSVSTPSASRWPVGGTDLRQAVHGGGVAT